ncbi:MAG: conjugal transfer protein TrbE, partial [Paracoccus denitrificans]
MIQTFAILIAVLGALLIGILFALVLKNAKRNKLDRFRSKDAGFADLLNYAAMVDDGVIVGKNGSFMAAWLYAGDDNASSTDQQREMVSFRINQALAGLGNGWMIHVDAPRRPAPNYSERGLSHFPDPITEMIDEERRQLFEGLGTMYEGYFVITATYFPPMLAEQKFVELMFDDDREKPSQKARTADLVEKFKRDVVSFESRLGAALKLTRLKGHEVMNEDGSTVTQCDLLRWLQF